MAENDRLELKRLHDMIISLYKNSDDVTRRVLFSCLAEGLDAKTSKQWIEVWSDQSNWM